MPLSRFDYEQMEAIARRIEQRGADLEAYLERVARFAQSLEERCRSPFADAVVARHGEWALRGRELAQSLKALGADLARIAESQRAAEEQEGARFAHLPQ
ncbi:MAG TPA: hypothetical protein VNK89_04080 [Thermoflexus sp.]|nr:hypothetical protein [Thermoflexus sp.]